jgi:hypothetical protein
MVSAAAGIPGTDYVCGNIGHSHLFSNLINDRRMTPLLPGNSSNFRVPKSSFQALSSKFGVLHLALA